MSDINLNLFTTTGTTANAKPQHSSVPASEKEPAAAPAQTKDVNEQDINNFMSNSPATLAAMAGINFTTPKASTGDKVATAAGETVFGEDIAAMVSSNLKTERYMARVDATPEYQKERIAASMAVLDNEI